MINRFQGDPAIKITQAGASMTFKGGQPVLDQGIENAVLISLFTRKNWWGNALATSENNKIGSDFEDVRTIIDVQTINDVADSARAALRWMISSGLAEKIDVTVTNPSGSQLAVAIAIYPPGRDVQKLLFLKNGINWIAQFTSPAHERLK